jgi:hypothetical protein
MQVIEVKHCRGAGTEKDIARTVTTYYDLDGNILAENDPLPNGALVSADNYYIVKKHPEGGFTYVMGFDSDDDPDLSVGDHDPRFATLDAALLAVRPW